MMFTGTNQQQDTRFSDKEKKFMKQMRFGDCLSKRVDMSKVKLDVLRPWISKKITDILHIEDDVVVEFVYNQLEEEKFPCPKKMQINMTGFLNGRNAREFMDELWALLLSAQESETGIPEEFIQQKKDEILKREEETAALLELRERETDLDKTNKDRHDTQNNIEKSQPEISKPKSRSRSKEVNNINKIESERASKECPKSPPKVKEKLRSPRGKSRDRDRSPKKRSSRDRSPRRRSPIDRSRDKRRSKSRRRSSDRRFRSRSREKRGNDRRRSRSKSNRRDRDEPRVNKKLSTPVTVKKSKSKSPPRKEKSPVPVDVNGHKSVESSQKLTKVQEKLLTLASGGKKDGSRSRTRSASNSSKSKKRSSSRSLSKSPVKAKRISRSRSSSSSSSTSSSSPDRSKKPNRKSRGRSVASRSPPNGKEDFEIQKKQNSVQKKRHYRTNKDSSSSTSPEKFPARRNDQKRFDHGGRRQSFSRGRSPRGGGRNRSRSPRQRSRSPRMRSRSPMRRSRSPRRFNRRRSPMMMGRGRGQRGRMNNMRRRSPSRDRMRRNQSPRDRRSSPWDRRQSPQRRSPPPRDRRSPFRDRRSPYRDRRSPPSRDRRFSPQRRSPINRDRRISQSRDRKSSQNRKSSPPRDRRSPPPRDRRSSPSRDRRSSPMRDRRSPIRGRRNSPLPQLQQRRKRSEDRREIPPTFKKDIRESRDKSRGPSSDWDRDVPKDRQISVAKKQREESEARVVNDESTDEPESSPENVKFDNPIVEKKANSTRDRKHSPIKKDSPEKKLSKQSLARERKEPVEVVESRNRKHEVIEVAVREEKRIEPKRIIEEESVDEKLRRDRLRGAYSTSLSRTPSPFLKQHELEKLQLEKKTTATTNNKVDLQKKTEISGGRKEKLTLMKQKSESSESEDSSDESESEEDKSRSKEKSRKQDSSSSNESDNEIEDVKIRPKKNEDDNRRLEKTREEFKRKISDTNDPEELPNKLRGGGKIIEKKDKKKYDSDSDDEEHEKDNRKRSKKSIKDDSSDTSLELPKKKRKKDKKSRKDTDGSSSDSDMKKKKHKKHKKHAKKHKKHKKHKRKSSKRTNNSSDSEDDDQPPGVTIINDDLEKQLRERALKSMKKQSVSD